MTTTFPSRLIIDDQQIMVVLDTSSARELAQEDECPDWVYTFEEMSKQSYSFSLSDGTYAELINQRREERISASEFDRMCIRLRRFLNLDFPVILGRRDVQAMLQLNANSWSEEECRELSKQAWDELLRCTQDGYQPVSPETVLEEIRAEWRSMLKGWQENVNLIRAVERSQLTILLALDQSSLLQGLAAMPAEEALAALQTLRTLPLPLNEELIAAFDPIPPVLVVNVVEALRSITQAGVPGVLTLYPIYAQQKAHVSEASCEPEAAWTNWIDQRLSWKVIGPLISKGVMKRFKVDAAGTFTDEMRSHLEVMYCWRQFSRMQQTKNGYDPDNIKKRNDGIDFDLYRFLKLRALVVTEDKGFLTGLADIKSYQTTWFYTPRNLANTWASGKSPTPAWPHPKHLSKC